LATNTPSTSIFTYSPDIKTTISTKYNPLINGWPIRRSESGALKNYPHYSNAMKQDEPWLLLTNIPPSKRTRQQILHTYAKRFEIEEHFKDIKWIERYEWHHIRKLTVARTVFMFAFLGWWLLLKARKAATEHL